MLPAVWGKNYISNHSILIASSSMLMELGCCRGKDFECGPDCRPTMELPHRVKMLNVSPFKPQLMNNPLAIVGPG